MSSHTTALIWNLAAAIRRLLIDADKSKPAAKFAASILVAAERELGR